MKNGIGLSIAAMGKGIAKGQTESTLGNGKNRLKVFARINCTFKDFICITELHIQIFNQHF